MLSGNTCCQNEIYFDAFERYHTRTKSIYILQQCNPAAILD